MKIGSTVTKKQYASPGGQRRNGEGLHRREELPGPFCYSYKREVTTKKGRCGGRGNYQKKLTLNVKGTWW